MVQIMKGFSIICLMLLGGLMARGQNAFYLYVPADSRTQDGNSSSFFPFVSNSARYQQVYAASEFDALRSLGGAWLLSILFRVDRTNGSPFGYTYRLQVNLSITSKRPDELSAIFDANVGTNETIVLPMGDINIFGGPGDDPSVFDVFVPFKKAFFYNPSAGNLLFDLRIAQRSSGFVEPRLDAWNRPADSVSRVFWGNINASTGLVDTVGLATLFNPFPNPSMTIVQSSNSLVLTWRTRPDVFTLQTTERLSAPLVWRAITNGIANDGLEKTYLVPLLSLGKSAYFRLIANP